MAIRQWLQKFILPMLKKAWQESPGASRKKADYRVFKNNDLTNPQHPFNVGQREMGDNNDRRARETLHNYLQECQRLEEHQRNERNYWDYYHR